jgi:LPS O-antigen subunit length determinant protein (WzzB/FepE family)
LYHAAAITNEAAGVRRHGSSVIEFTSTTANTAATRLDRYRPFSSQQMLQVIKSEIQQTLIINHSASHVMCPH